MDNPTTQPVVVGSKVEEFSLKDPDGKTITLSEITGQRGVVIGFLHGTYCPHCIQQLARSNRYADALGERGVAMVWVLEDQPVNVSTYRLAAQPPPRFTMLPDSKPSIKSRLGMAAEEDHLAHPLNRILYIDAQRVIRYVEQRDNPHAPPDMERLLSVIEGDHPE